MDEKLFDAATQNFNLPHDIVPLPSQGLFYKNKKKSVKVGYLTAQDENLLISAAGSDGNIVTTLLRNKIYEHDLKPEELLEGDVEAILIFLRNTAFGSEYTIGLVDPVTKKPFQTTVSLDELNIRRTENQPDENGYFTTKLPRSEVFAKLKPLTYSEISEIDKMVETYPIGRVAPRVTWRLNKIVQEINGEIDRNYIVQFIESMPIMDSKYIRNFIRDNQPSLDLKRTVKAPSGELVTFEITFGVEFFRPFF
jgi:hypothetical protein